VEETDPAAAPRQPAVNQYQPPTSEYIAEAAVIPDLDAIQDHVTGREALGFSAGYLKKCIFQWIMMDNKRYLFGRNNGLESS
jgi:hypothetical protein